MAAMVALPHRTTSRRAFSIRWSSFFMSFSMVAGAYPTVASVELFVESRAVGNVAILPLPRRSGCPPDAPSRLATAFRL